MQSEDSCFILQHNIALSHDLAIRVFVLFYALLATALGGSVGAMTDQPMQTIRFNKQ
jgi:hypothetical protein